MKQVVIFGAGVAGVAAARRLKTLGYHPFVARSGESAASLSSGAWDFCKFKHSTTSLPFLDSLSELRHFSPLKAALENNDCVHRIRDFASRLGFEFSASGFGRYANSAGMWKPSFLVNNLARPIELHSLNRKRIGLVSHPAWRFDSPAIAESLEQNARKIGIEISVTSISMRQQIDGSDWPLTQVANRLTGDQALRLKLQQMILESIAGIDLDAILLPPLFLSETQFKELANGLGVPCAELLSTIEPIAGSRLNDSLLVELDRLEIPHLRISQSEIFGKGAEVQKVRLTPHSSGPSFDVEPVAVVLATGKFFSGGITTDFSSVSEPLLNLPLFANHDGEQIQYRSQLANEPEALRKLGARIDDSFRPMQSSGTQVWNNVYVTGSLVGGIDFAASGLGLGTMFLMGEACADVVAKI